MASDTSNNEGDFDAPLGSDEEPENTAEEDLWFLPGPMEEEPDFLPPGPRADPPETSLVGEWAAAEAGSAALLAHVAARLGALDDRLLRAPEGWRHRLALIEAAELSWLTGDRIGADRLALWISMRVSGAQDDMGALLRSGWAVRRLTGGPRPEEGLSEFLDRRDPENMGEETEPFSGRANAWADVMSEARDLHPITRSCMGFHLWALSGLGQFGDQAEAAVTVARVAIGGGHSAVFAPLAVGGGKGCVPQVGLQNV